MKSRATGPAELRPKSNLSNKVRPNTKLRALEFSVFRSRPKVADVELGPAHRVLAAVSGGADSVAMLQVLARLRGRWGFGLEVAYVHHGSSRDDKVNRYRTRAENRVRQLAKDLGLEFVALGARTATTINHRNGGQKNGISRANPESESEEALREFRWNAFQTYASAAKVDICAMGHHADDLFETRLIRLMRGTGPQGLRAMSAFSQTAGAKASSPSELFVWRPLLATSRVEIQKYLAEIGFKKGRAWVEDPTNLDARYLRNAIRRDLLPVFEKVRPGSVKAMARSLEILAADGQVESSAPNFGTDSLQVAVELDRAQLMAQPLAQRRQCLAKWLLAQGVRGFSKAHAEEVLKRIDTPQKRLTFVTGGRVWLVERVIRLADQPTKPSS